MQDWHFNLYYASLELLDKTLPGVHFFSQEELELRSTTRSEDEFINQIIVDIPNISATTIPLKAFKALYLRDTRKDVEGSKALLKKAINDNPYIKIPETELSRIYFDEQIADSAIYYGKKAF